MNLKEEIKKLKEELDVTLVAHFYQRDEVFELADITGDSLELAKKVMNTNTKFVVFCGVGFMGESVKIMSPQKRVLMPKVACCAMARMIDEGYFEQNLKKINEAGIPNENILPITYINSSARVKARVGMMGGMVCTSSNAYKIIEKGLKSGKKIFFVPDRCLGQNFAKSLNLKSAVVGDGTDLKEADIICYNGFCSVHQQFSVEDIEFYREKFPGILVAVHPECDPSVCDKADFVGSTSQLITYIKNLDPEQKIVVGTEFNMVNRLRTKNTYILSSTKPECPTMNETTLEDVYRTLKSIKDDNISKETEIYVDEETIKWAKVALERMFEV
ncbi:quinolinate synthase NadA [Aliarcobacter butzleri]|uniref:quinolinate synthase NadA n=1 Tax=Aliarcobacter butzleri TaxID=28197 RepID=UPI001EDB9F2A|nr:quinolinate synthase NadA [Aliarcobacter butzleri]MCG3661395.1 quinolinate synthase NadA [Aliarcobacter butzleri]MCG3699164.1 quinolinate synthase NadA [Aliarcobacter butzleri]MDN5080384.1 quinolinate synthase NadA [Aliarcobacter butzleri]MDN5082785.1 quinolinate synthase NadA [Aliarcobacter butzleri]MDN5084955.1 quinolinate synthase NadA [Aliarcobacter butzleri]